MTENITRFPSQNQSRCSTDHRRAKAPVDDCEFAIGHWQLRDSAGARVERVERRFAASLELPERQIQGNVERVVPERGFGLINVASEKNPVFFTLKMFRLRS